MDYTKIAGDVAQVFLELAPALTKDTVASTLSHLGLEKYGTTKSFENTYLRSVRSFCETYGRNQRFGKVLKDAKAIDQFLSVFLGEKGADHDLYNTVYYQVFKKRDVGDSERLSEPQFSELLGRFTDIFVIETRRVMSATEAYQERENIKRTERVEHSLSEIRIAIEDFSAGNAETRLFGIIKELADTYVYLRDEDQRRELRTLLTEHYRQVALSNRLAPRILAYLDTHVVAGPLAVILRAMCLVIQEKRLSNDEMAQLVTALGYDKDSADGTSSEDQRTKDAHLARVLTFAMYHYPELLAMPATQEALGMLALRGGWWEDFFAESYLRYLCHYVFLPPEVEPLFRDSAQKYREREADRPLAKVWDVVVDPASFLRTRKPSASRGWVVDQFRPVAGQCRSATECRWCLTAMVRVSALLPQNEDEPEYYNEVRELINAFPGDIVGHSPALQFRKLTAILREFLKTRSAEALKVFEQEFDPALLHPQQIPHLQMEYGAVLAVVLELRPDDFAALDVSQNFIRGRDPLESKFFKNDFAISDRKKLDEIREWFSESANFADAQTWLQEFMSILVRTQLHPVIDTNHLRVQQYPCTLLRPAIRHSVGTAVRKSMEKFAALDLESHATFAAHSAVAFPLAGYNMNKQETVWHYVQAALGDDTVGTRYYVVRNAVYIAKALYSRFYYGPQEQREQVKSLADTFVGITQVGDPMTEAGMHWAYMGALNYSGRTPERHFLKQLHPAVARAFEAFERRPKDDEIEAAITDEVLEIAPACIDSWMAKSLASDLLRHPEMWNLIGTTVMVTSPDRSERDLDNARKYYSLASTFARSRGMYAYKYRYNRIRVSAELFEKRGYGSVERIFRGDLLFLRDRNSRYFAFRQDCTAKLWEILDRTWDDQSTEFHEAIAQTLSKAWWLNMDAKHLPALLALRKRCGLSDQR